MHTPSAQPFAGRSQQLARLEACISTGVRTGVASSIVVSGEAGMGKTRLLEAFEQSCRSAGITTGRCVGSDICRNQPYEMILDLLRDLNRQREAAIDDRFVDKVFADLVNGTADLHGRTASANVLELVHLGIRQRLVQAVHEFATEPLVLLFDDLERSDETALGLASLLRRRLRRTATVFVFALSTDIWSPTSALQSFLDELHRDRHVGWMELAPLSDADAVRVFESVAGECDPQTVASAVRLCQGNPAYLREFGYAEVAGATGAPARLRNDVRRRVSQLSPEAQQLCELVAIAGRPVDHVTVERALPSLSASALAAATRETVARRLLAIDCDCYAFRQDLVRQTIAAELLPGERRRLHSAIAEALDDDSERSVPDRVGLAVQIAHHYQQAKDPASALTAVVAAARLATQAHAVHDADRLYVQALDLWAHTPALQRKVDQMSLWWEASESARWAGDLDRSIGLIQQAISEAAESDSVRLRIALGRQLWHAGRFQESLRVLRSLAEVLHGSERDPEYAEVCAAEAGMLAVSGQYDEALARAATALELSENMPATRAHALSTLGISRTMLGDGVGGVNALRQSLDLARKLHSTEAIVRAYTNLSYVQDYTGLFAEAADTALAGVRYAHTHGLMPTAGAMLAASAATSLLKLGRGEQLRTELVESISAEVPAGIGIHLQLSAAELDVAAGDLDGADEHVRAAHRLSEDTTEFPFCSQLSAVRAEILLWRSSPYAARDVIAQGFADVDGHDTMQKMRLAWLALWAKAEISQGRARPGHRSSHFPSMDEQLDDEAEALLDDVARNPRTDVLNAWLAMCRAELTRATQLGESTAWQAAADHFQQLNFRHRAVYCLMRFAEAKLAAGEAADVSCALRTGFDLAQSMRAAALSAHLESLAKAARVSLTGISRDAPGSPPADSTGLTTREREVLGLLAEGRTNRAIAGTLFLSQHTVAIHVSNILSKLNVHTRGEAAATAISLGLIELSPRSSSELPRREREAS